jgi:hypothetical protein
LPTLNIDSSTPFLVIEVDLRYKVFVSFVFEMTLNLVDNGIYKLPVLSTIFAVNTALVTVSFTGGSTEFKITNLLVNGKAIDGFAQDKKEYTMDLGFAATEPVVTYEYQGEAKTLAIITAATVENNAPLPRCYRKYPPRLSRGRKMAIPHSRGDRLSQGKLSYRKERKNA